MDDLRPLPERHALCSLRLLPTLFRFAALAILFVGLLLTIRAVTDGATTATARAKTPPGPAAPTTSAPGSSLPPPNPPPPSPSPTSPSPSPPPPSPSPTPPSVAAPSVAPPSSPGSVLVYLGNGCFWERQWAYVQIETQQWQRPAVNVSSKVGYAGGSRAGANGRVCYHCGFACPDDYTTLGHAEVVQARSPLTPHPSPQPSPLTPALSPYPVLTPSLSPTPSLTPGPLSAPTRCASTRPPPSSSWPPSRG